MIKNRQTIESTPGRFYVYDGPGADFTQIDGEV